MFIPKLILFFFVLIWLGCVSFLRLRKKSTYRYLIFFTIFFAYLYKVLDVTLFEFQTLLLMRYFIPRLMLRGLPTDKALNLIPLITLSTKDIMTSFLNILLFLPFGIGFPIVTKYRFKNTLLIGAALSLAIELLQYLTGRVAGMTFRIADVNDVIFNTLGTVIGYGVFHFALQFFRSRKNV